MEAHRRHVPSEWALISYATLYRTDQQEELVDAAAFRYVSLCASLFSATYALFSYITDAITKEEALAMLKSRAASKAEREQRVCEAGYPAYVTSAGWLGYDDEKVKRLTLEALHAGFNHFKVRNVDTQYT